MTMTIKERALVGLLAVVAGVFIGLAVSEQWEKRAPATFLDRWAPVLDLPKLLDPPAAPAVNRDSKSDKGPCMSKRLACYA